MARSLLDQLGQIDASGTYADGVSGVHTDVVAEGQLSLEGDMNVVRSLMKDLIVKSGEEDYATINWFDPSSMSINGIAKKFFIVDTHQGTFEDVLVSGYTTTAFDAAIKTITGHNDGAGNSSTSGVVVNATIPYRLSIRDNLTQNPIDDGENNEVYGRLSWNSTAYVVSFYSMKLGVETPYTFVSSSSSSSSSSSYSSSSGESSSSASPTPSGVLSIDMAYVCVSRQYKDLPWERFLDFTFWDLAGPVGIISDTSVAVSGMQYLYNGLTTQHAVNVLGDKLGHADTNGEGAALILINNTGTSGTGSYFTLGGTGVNLQITINEIAAQIGGLTSTTFTFTEENVLASDDFIYPALEKLDLKWGDLASVAAGEGASLVGIEDAGEWTAVATVEAALQEIYEKLDDVSGWVKVSTTTTGTINAGSVITVPGSETYTPDNGKNMDWYVDGQLQLEGTGNDYTEIAGSPSSTITTLFTIRTGTNLIFMIRK